MPNRSGPKPPKGGVNTTLYPETTHAALESSRSPGSVIGLPVPRTRRSTINGDFGDADKLAAAANNLGGHGESLDIALNSIDPDLLAHAVNRIVEYALHATADTETLRRYWLLSDLDSARPSGLRVLRYRQVCQATGLSRTTIWRLVRRGEFPPPRRLTGNTIGWLAHEVDSWLASRCLHTAGGHGLVPSVRDGIERR